MSRRAVAPVTAVVLLTGCTVLIAAALGVTVIDDVDLTPAPQAAISVTANADTNRLLFLHRTGDTLDVERLALRIEIDGRPLEHQPPVPFFAATGFHGGPSGPLNSAGDGTWTVGERASIRLAGTNSPTLSPGSRVTVRIFSSGKPVTMAETTA